MTASHTGSPVGPFRQGATLAMTVSSNQVVVAAPGAGNAIYVQTISIDMLGKGAGTEGQFIVHSGNGTRLCSLSCVGQESSGANITFPGGFQLPANDSLQVDASQTANINVTYVTGVSL